MAQNRKVLVVSYFFPPAGAVGVHRTLRFLRNLPDYGWEGIVLTASNAKVPELEPTLLEKVPPATVVCRTRSFESLNYGRALDGTSSASHSSRFLKRVTDLPKDLWRYLAMPDDKIGWIPSAVRAGAQLIKQYNIQAVLVTGKPFSSYWIGHRLSRQFDIPWLMDVRDLWHLNRRSRPKSRVHFALEGRMERKMVHSASAVIANTPGNRRDFIEHYPECPPDKFVTITNGYDRHDFQGTSPETFTKFTVGFIGTFYFEPDGKPSFYRRWIGIQQRRSELFDTHSPRYLFEALAELLRKRPEWREQVDVVIAGPGQAKVQALIEQFGLNGCARHLGWVSHSASLDLIRRSHVACLMLARGVESAGWIPSKLYPYMASGTPVLALVPEGDAAAIVRDTGCGLVAAPDDVEQIQTALQKLFEANATGRAVCAPNRVAIESFEGSALTGRLADCLDSVVAGKFDQGAVRSPQCSQHQGASGGRHVCA